MKTITQNDVNEIREIKESLGALEGSLEKFMVADLSNKELRGEMREVLSAIESMESKLSAKLSELR